MSKNNQFTFSTEVFLAPLLILFVMWFVYYLEIKFDWNFNKFGVYPRTFLGLQGVLLSPFIHSNAIHLLNNSVPLFVLSSSLFYFYKNVSWKILAYGGILVGMLTWGIARESYHIGASGIVYLLFSFIFFSGIIKKHYRLVAVSLVVIFLYGSMIWYVLPIKEGISWEGHLSGLIIGLIFAFIYKNKGIVKEEFQFTQTSFDDLFDENGNLIQQENNTIEEEITPSVDE